MTILAIRTVVSKAYGFNLHEKTIRAGQRRLYPIYSQHPLLETGRNSILLLEQFRHWKDGDTLILYTIIYNEAHQSPFQSSHARNPFCLTDCLL